MDQLPDDVQAGIAGVDPIVWVVLGGVLLLVLLGVAIVVVARRNRTARYQQRYGREYERTVARVGSRSAAHDELDQRSRRREGFTLRKLPAARRDELRSSWEELQADFVEAPASTVRHAEVLLDEAARERGYPDADAEQRLRDLALDHSDEVAAYREASESGDEPDETTLRHRMVAGRALLEALLEAGRGGGTARAAAPTTPAPQEVDLTETRRDLWVPDTASVGEDGQAR